MICQIYIFFFTHLLNKGYSQIHVMCVYVCVEGYTGVFTTGWSEAGSGWEGGAASSGPDTSTCMKKTKIM